MITKSMTKRHEMSNRLIEYKSCTKVTPELSKDKFKQFQSYAYTKSEIKAKILELNQFCCDLGDAKVPNKPNLI